MNGNGKKTYPNILNCIRCNNELDEPGALLFSPSTPDSLSQLRFANDVAKYHLCVVCYEQVCAWIVSTGWTNFPCECPDQCCKIHDKHSMPPHVGTLTGGNCEICGHAIILHDDSGFCTTRGNGSGCTCDGTPESVTG